MMTDRDPRDLRIEDYDYALPDRRIARYPLADRSAAKLLMYKDGGVSEYKFYDLPDLLPPGALVIGNQTRVIHARLHFPVGEGGRSVEIFLLEPMSPPDHARALGSTSAVTWKCLVGGNRRWKQGSLSLYLSRAGRSEVLTIVRESRTENTFEITFSWNDNSLSFGEIVEAAGSIPLPPYLNRKSEEADRHRYQTVFAAREGSVAAPTAGLHITPEVLQSLADKGIFWRALTLHVGAGTFKPVSSPTLGGHAMHREYFSVPLLLLRELHDRIAGGRSVVSVGTTSMRCLESLFYFGAELLAGGRKLSDSPAVLDQWVAHEARFSLTDVAPALAALINEVERLGMESFDGYTRLLMTPATRPRVVEGLITNFHQPRSTLLLLVGAMVGHDWHMIYDYALARDFRFLSYGDSSLLWRRGAGAN